MQSISSLCRPIAALLLATALQLQGGVPAITTQPRSETRMVGASVGFTIAASGSTPLSYQWKRNGSALPGATDSTFTVASVQTSDSGVYRVAVANLGGSVSSDPATLTVVENVTAAYAFTTLAGFAGAGTEDGTGNGARFRDPYDVAIDPSGNLFITDRGNGTIRKATPAGMVTTLAGQAGSGGYADGTGSAARFGSLWGIARAPDGNLYVCDTGNLRVRKITPAGVVSTVAGGGIRGVADGVGSAAQFILITGIAVDTSGNAYVTDQGAYTIRRIVLATGEVTTFAGQAYSPGSTDGNRTLARFISPQGLAYTAAGELLVADTGSSTIRKIALSTGMVTTLAGLAGNSGGTDATGASARFSYPSGLCADSSGNVYVSESSPCRLRKVTASGVVTTLAGQTDSRGSADGTGTAARFNQPQGTAVDSSGNVFVVDSGNHTVRKISPAGVVTTFAGIVGIGFVDDTGPAARFQMPQGIATGRSGTVYVSDTGNGALRMISADGTTTTLATQLFFPYGLVVDESDNVLVAELSAQTISRVTSDGVVSTWAGARMVSGSADGVGAEARFFQPHDVTRDGAGNLYVADEINRTLRKITPAGVVSTLAGLAGSSGSVDGVGSAARFMGPGRVAATADGIVYVSDWDRIRKVMPDGTVTTFVGPGDASGAVDGLGAQARLAAQGMAVDASGNLFVADSSTIRLVTPAGLVTTIGGSASLVGSADGIGSAARFWNPFSIAVDAVGRLYIADTRNNTIRVGESVGPVIIASPVSRAVAVGGNVILGASLAGTGGFTYQWKKDGAVLAGRTGAALTLTNVQLADAGAYMLLVSSPTGNAETVAAALLVTVPPVITSATAATGTVGVAFNYVITASNSPLAVFSATGLPPGLALNPASGEISGAPSATGSYAVSLGVANPEGSSAAAALTITVSAPRAPDITIQPASVMVIPGNSASFAVAANNFSSESLTFRWYFTPAASSTPQALSDLADKLTGAGTASLTVSNIQVADTGDYVCVVTNGVGPTTSTAAQLTLVAGFEADMNGNGIVSITDWVKVGRIVAGLDVVANGSDFQKADCAGRATLGNGVLSISDWVQAGRYAAGLDPSTAVGGPSAPPR